MVFVDKLLLLTALLIACIKISYSQVHNEYIVKFKDLETLENSYHVLKHFDVLGNKYAVIQTFKNTDKDNNLLISEKNHNTYLLGAPNELDKFNFQWGLFNQGQNEPITYDKLSPVPSKVGIDINILNTWKQTKGSKDIIIAVIDTGVDIRHIELKDNIWTNFSELNGIEGVDDDKNGFVDDIHGVDFVDTKAKYPIDLNGHGTHCAGIIAASHSQGVMAGVMSDVSIMPLRTLDKRGAGKVDQAIKAFGYAIDMGANIISNSWGSRGHSQILEDLIKTAYSKNIVVIAAAGNSRYNDNDKYPTYPANYPHVISVSAINARNRHSSYSSFGKQTVHLAAPGTNIFSTFLKHKGRPYRVLSGTSMAAPFVSGAVGLYMSEFGVDQNPEEIKLKLIKSATKAEHTTDMNMAGGYLNIESFMNL